MFKDKIFNISFLISFCWHIFCIFAFVLVITPKGFTFNKFPTIAFLGPILEEDAFKPGYDIKSALMPAPYKEDFAQDGEIGEQDFIFDIASALSADILTTQAQFAQPTAQKQIPDAPPLLLDTPAQPGAMEESGLPIWLKVEGLLARRAIVYLPTEPAIPEWAKREGLEFSVDLRIFVSKDGIVQKMERLNTSGFIEIDLAAMKCVRQILFGARGENALQEGGIKVVLDDKN